jgi:hypothetical protein
MRNTKYLRIVEEYAHELCMVLREEIGVLADEGQKISWFVDPDWERKQGFVVYVFFDFKINGQWYAHREKLDNKEIWDAYRGDMMESLLYVRSKSLAHAYEIDIEMARANQIPVPEHLKEG